MIQADPFRMPGRALSKGASQLQDVSLLARWRCLVGVREELALEVVHGPLEVLLVAD